MTHLRPTLLLLAGIALALAGYVAIVFSCPYGIVATFMTAYVKIPGLPFLIAYKRILSVAVILILYAIYLWTRGRPGDSGQQTGKALPIAFVGIGVAAIGFLAVNYPCPYPISLSMLLDFDVEFAGIIVPFWVAVVTAACILLYAAYEWMKQRPAAESAN